jgi:O-antigen ligase
VSRWTIDRESWWIALLCAPFWAIGTNLLDQRWYVAHGISVGDVLFLGWFGLALMDARRRARIDEALRNLTEHTALVIGFIAWLLVSLAVNSFRYGAQWADVLAILRLGYFSAIVLFVVDHVRRHGFAAITLAFVAGVSVLTLERLDEAIRNNALVIFGLPLLKDPNVIGNMLGVAVFFCSLGILAGHVLLSLALAIVLAAASMMTFSKGTWAIVLVGIAANLVALVFARPLDRRGKARAVLAAIAFLAVLGALAAVNIDRIQRLFDFKVESTATLGTVNYRYRFALAAMYAMGDHPFVGVGFRNYSVVERLYPEVMPEPSANAHNVFAQVAAIGGAPALVLWLLLFVYPFVDLWRIFQARGRPDIGALYTLLAFLVFLGSGSVQLQLMAQPFFWVFTGIVRGWRLREYVPVPRKVARLAPHPLPG